MTLVQIQRYKVRTCKSSQNYQECLGLSCLLFHLIHLLLSPTDPFLWDKIFKVPEFEFAKLRYIYSILQSRELTLTINKSSAKLMLNSGCGLWSTVPYNLITQMLETNTRLKSSWQGGRWRTGCIKVNFHSIHLHNKPLVLASCLSKSRQELTGLLQRKRPFP